MNKASYNKFLEPEMKALDTIKKTREYLDYLERHINNVKKAWIEVQIKCSDLVEIYDDSRFWSLHAEVERHDLSKMGPHEFTQYRKYYYPTEGEMSDGIAEAWRSHILNNPHHWENWTKNDAEGKVHPHASSIHCTHMVIDWLAMSYEFNDTPREYYERKKDDIKLPGWAIKFIYEIFKRLEA